MYTFINGNSLNIKTQKFARSKVKNGILPRFTRTLPPYKPSEGDSFIRKGHNALPGSVELSSSKTFGGNSKKFCLALSPVCCAYEM